MVRWTGNLEFSGHGWFRFGASAGKSVSIVQHLRWLFFWVVASVQEIGGGSCIREIVAVAELAVKRIFIR